MNEDSNLRCRLENYSTSLTASAATPISWSWWANSISTITIQVIPDILANCHALLEHYSELADKSWIISGESIPTYVFLLRVCTYLFTRLITVVSHHEINVCLRMVKERNMNLQLQNNTAIASDVASWNEGMMGAANGKSLQYSLEDVIAASSAPPPLGALHFGSSSRSTSPKTDELRTRYEALRVIENSRLHSDSKVVRTWYQNNDGSSLFHHVF